MSLLRVRCSISDTSQQCQWALVDGGREPVYGEGPFAGLPRHAERVQLVIPAAEVLITRARLPSRAKRFTEQVLAYAVEEQTLSEPDANHASWLGSVGDGAVLAVMDKQGLRHRLDAFGAAGIAECEVFCETLLLPWTNGEWSLAWDGREGFVRFSELEGAMTDCGDRQSPPLALRLMLNAAAARGARPASIALYVTAPDVKPVIEAWERELGVALRFAGPWDWRRPPSDTDMALMRERRRWRPLAGTLARLRPAVWIAASALMIHALSVVADWALLAGEQRMLRQRMESRFREAFPDAVSVVDPALQMRRKLAEARRAAGSPDGDDFLPMIEKVASAARDLPAGSLRIVSYESGRLMLELASGQDAVVRGLMANLQDADLNVDTAPAVTRPGGGAVVIAVRAL